MCVLLLNYSATLLVRSIRLPRGAAFTRLALPAAPIRIRVPREQTARGLNDAAETREDSKPNSPSQARGTYTSTARSSSPRTTASTASRLAWARPCTRNTRLDSGGVRRRRKHRGGGRQMARRVTCAATPRSPLRPLVRSPRLPGPYSRGAAPRRQGRDGLHPRHSLATPRRPHRPVH